jgi:hypothetical protein
VAIEGVFEPAAAGGAIFRAATGFDEYAIAEVQECVRRSLLRTFMRCDLLMTGDHARDLR